MFHARRFKFAAFFLLGLSALFLGNCQVSESESGTIVRLVFHDSLTVEAGKYDSILVDLHDTAGNKTHPGIFNEPYNRGDAERVANIQLEKKAPDPVIIRIYAFKNGDTVWAYEIQIIGGIRSVKPSRYLGPPPLVPDDPGDDVLPNEVIIHQGQAFTLFTGETDTLDFRVLPAGASQDITWQIANPAIAEILPGHKIKGLSSGITRITATTLAVPAISASVDVIVVADVVKPQPIKPESIAFLMPVPMTLAAPEAGAAAITADLSAKVMPEAADQALIWSSQDPSIAQIVSGNKIQAMQVGETRIVAKAKADTAVVASFAVKVIRPAKVDAIAISPLKMTLYSNGETGKVTVVMTGNDTGAQYALSSSNVALATVDIDGKVQGLKAGKAVISATVVGSPQITSACSVTVITDAPKVTVSPDQNIAYGGEAVFDVTVKQDHGSVAEIRADMEGDGVYEQSVAAKDSARFKAKYSESKTFTAVFEVRDSEGNLVKLERKVQVALPLAPEVTIIDPAAAITINQNSYTVRFTVKDPTKPSEESKDSLVAGLADGANVITVSRSNSGGTGLAKVTITVDRTAPGVPVLAAQPEFTNKNSVTWSWGAVTGAAKYQVRLGDNDFANAAGNIEKTATSHALTGLADGEYALFVRSLDGLGNASSPAKQMVTVDTKSPVVKITSPVNNATVMASPLTVAWTVDGEELTGSESFTAGDGKKSIVRTATDKAGNSGKDSIAVILDKDKPLAPKMNATGTTASPTKAASLVWKWTSGGNGNGTYRYWMDAATMPATTTQIKATEVTLANPAEGTRTLYVQESDDQGNWSAAASHALVVDRTGPVVTVDGGASQTVTAIPFTLSLSAADNPGGMGSVSVAGADSGNGALTLAAGKYTRKLGLKAGANALTVTANDNAGNASTVSVTVTYNAPTITITSPVNGLVTSISSVTVYYDFTSGGVTTAKSKAFTLSSEGATPLEITEPAAVAKSITVHYQPKVVFVRKTATGTANGTSWDNAYRDIRTAMESVRGMTSGNKFWISNESYDAIGTGISGNYLQSGVSLYGGFAATGQPNSEASRSAVKTIMTNSGSNSGALLYVYNGSNSVIDGISFSLLVRGDAIYTNAYQNLTVRNCDFQSHLGVSSLLEFSEAGVTLENCKIANMKGGGTIFAVSGGDSNVMIRNCSITNNQVQTMMLAAASTITVAGSTITGNIDPDTGGLPAVSIGTDVSLILGTGNVSDMPEFQN